LHFVGVTSDWLFPASEVKVSAERAASVGANATYAEIDTKSGHDAFLKDWAELKEAIKPPLESESETIEKGRVHD
jgi:homoserine O-acetyltransferase